MDAALNVLIWSPDELLATEAADDACAKAGKGAEVVTIDADVGLDGLEEALFAGSLFSSERVVLVRNAQSLSKSGVERLASTLRREGDPAPAVVVAVSERQPAQLISTLTDVAKVQKLSRPRRGELVAWVVKRMKAAGLVAPGDAAATLVDAVGENLRDLMQAIEQLSLRVGQGGRVESADVLRHFTASSDQPIWVLFDAIVRHDGAKAFDSVGRLLEHGDEPLPVLGAIVSQVRGIIRAKSLVERGPMKDSDLARTLGVSEGRAGVMKRQSARLSWDWLLGVHRLCAEADVELKGGDDGAVLPAQVVLERFVAGALEAG